MLRIRTPSTLQHPFPHCGFFTEYMPCHSTMSHSHLGQIQKCTGARPSPGKVGSRRSGCSAPVLLMTIPTQVSPSYPLMEGHRNCAPRRAPRRPVHTRPPKVVPFRKADPGLLETNGSDERHR
ncbi:uncharacterized protein BO97DRAFT_282877 [Aspergillus homomorphus CBS 101889]|uniref:Uncharacterized protein n=1 Tax=Aspergillus homomorphus (strain CBS 101889) TaxID=1450537 RepID=A0A395I3M2_ASPHC|nr:hypothetical protein BO97DRAFT_282877 [Aspergillus homomorphus CBS 101889]RAL14316.1 hypothetical protein BO97DRAFT_282877 [Aspergillus homomorphus CBS 101889]